MLELVRDRRTHLTVFSRSAGLRLEPVGDSWAVFSARSGDTLQLNNEAAAVLEGLSQGPLSEELISVQLADASGTSPEHVAAQLRELWPQLLALGFIDEVV